MILFFLPHLLAPSPEKGEGELRMGINAF